MLAVFLGVFGALLLLTLLCETQYVSSAKVYLYHSTTKSSLLSRVNLDTTMMSSASLTDTERATYEDLAITGPVVTPVISDLHLSRKRKSLQIVEFIPFVRDIIHHFRPDFGRRDMTYEELTNKSLVHILFPRPYLKAAMMEDSDILEFSTSADSMDLAIALANAAAKSFVAKENAMRRDECRLLAEATASELPKARENYEKALAELREVRQREKIVDLDTEGQQLVERYFTVSSDRDANKLSLLKAQSMLGNVRAQMAKRPEFRKSSETTQRSSLIDSVKLTLRDLYMDLAASKSRLTAEHPSVKEIENKIEEAKRILKNENLKAYGSETVSTDPTFSYLNERAAEYAAQVAGYESQDAAYAMLLADLDKLGQDYPRRSAAAALLSARVEANQTFLNNLTQLEAQALAGEGLDLSIAHVVEPAATPGKIDDYMRPKLSLMLAVGLCAGVFLALFAALAAAYADETVTGREQVTARGAACLGAIPRRGVAGRRQALRRLRDMLYPAGQPGPEMVVLAGIDGSDSGAADLALGLGRALAREGRDTLVVDANLAGPGNLHVLAGLPAGPGLAEAVSGKAELGAVCVPGPEEHLTVLPAGLPGVTEAEADRLADSPAMRAALAVLRGRFAAVVVAAAPLSRSGDALVYGRLADALILTPVFGRTSGQALAQAASEARAATGRSALAVLDGAPEDDLTPREEWEAAKAWLRRKRLAARPGV